MSRRNLEEVSERVHHFMRGWDQGEVISASVTAEGQAMLTYTDLGVLLDAMPVASKPTVVDRVQCDCGWGHDPSQVNPRCPRHRPETARLHRVTMVQAAHRLVMSNDQDESQCLCGELLTQGFQYDEHAEHVADAVLAALYPKATERIGGFR